MVGDGGDGGGGGGGGGVWDMGGYGGMWVVVVPDGAEDLGLMLTDPPAFLSSIPACTRRGVGHTLPRAMMRTGYADGACNSIRFTSSRLHVS